MKKNIPLLISIVYALFFSFTYAQDQDTLTTSEWNYGVETDLYFTDPFVFLPIFTADKGKLHLEARYNYEDLKTRLDVISHQEEFLKDDIYRYLKDAEDKKNEKK